MATTNNKLAIIESFSALDNDPQRMIELLEETLGGVTISAGDLTRIKFPSGGSTIWEIPTARGIIPTTNLDVVMVYTRVQRAYWEPTDDRTKSKTPDCWADDAKHGTHPQMQDDEGHTVFGECDDCWFAEFGSAVGPDGNPRSGQACKLVRPVYFLSELNRIPMWIAFPPTSLKPFRQYLLDLVSEGISYTEVVTRLALEKTLNTRGDPYAVIKPQIIGDLSDQLKDRARQAATWIKPQLSKIRAAQTVADD
ncbi:MAG: hypothetical protein ACJ8LM_16735 [Candidatus Udaeobacter sp.]